MMILLLTALAYAGTLTQIADLDVQRENPLAGVIAQRMSDGRVYAVGAKAPVVGSFAGIFDPVTEQWSTATDPPFNPHQIFRVQNDNVFLYSGNPGNAAYYHWPTDTYTALSAPPDDRLGALITSTPGHEKIFIVGGQDLLGITSNKAYIYDTATDTWSTTVMPRAVQQGTVTSVHHPSDPDRWGVVVIGGLEDYGPGITYHDVTMFFDSAVGSWAAQPAAVWEGYDQAAMRWHKSSFKVFVSGGKYGPTGLGADTYTYDPWTDTWVFQGNMNIARAKHSMVKMGPGNSDILVAGGVYDPNNWTLETPTLERFNVITKWGLEADTLAEPAYELVMFYLPDYPNKVWMGGGDGFGVASRLDFYRWTKF